MVSFYRLKRTKMKGKAIYQKQDETEYFPTPTWVKDKLYEMIPENSVLLDPCCGAGELEENNKNIDVICQDLVKRTDKYQVELIDFLKDGLSIFAANAYIDGVIMNPPFGLTKEFVEKAFSISDDVYIIAPVRCIFNKFKDYIVDFYGDWKISRDFNVLISIGCFHLHKFSGFQFGCKNNIANNLLLPKVSRENTLEKYFKKTTSLVPDKPFICLRITKARIIRGEELIKESDIFEANDVSAFLAQSANLNTKVGSEVAREICYFDTMAEAQSFRNRINNEASYIRQYCYEYGNLVLDAHYIPCPGSLL